MKAKIPKKRGIALIISLFVALLVVMFVTAMVSLLPQTLDDATNSKEGRASVAAAQAGMEYAWCRLQEKPSWKGDGNAVTVNTANLMVVEDRGNIWGFLTSSSGNKSQFRIRFNYQNASGSPNDGQAGDPAPNHLILSPNVSFNNLSSPTAAV